MWGFYVTVLEVTQNCSSVFNIIIRYSVLIIVVGSDTIIVVLIDNVVVITVL